MAGGTHVLTKIFDDDDSWDRIAQIFDPEGIQPFSRRGNFPSDDAGDRTRC